MLILGKTNDDKGKQLEQLAGGMLEVKGYRNIRFNTTGAGGAEYDVTGEFSVPPVGRGRARRIKIVGECKARKDPANMTDWQKFLGKIYLEELKRPEQISGVFIAVSGYNSPVASSYEEVSERRNTIELVGEDDIQEFLLEKYKVCSLQQVATGVSRFTERTSTSIELCYYDRNCYWLVAFEKGAYTLFDALGQSLQEEALGDLRGMIETATALDTFVDLQNENAARRRGTFAQKQVLGRLMFLAGSGTNEQMFAPSLLLDKPTESSPPIQLPALDPPFSEEELIEAASALEERGWIERDEEEVAFKQLDESGRCANIADILRFWLVGDSLLISLYEGICSQFYDFHVDEALLDEVLQIQGNLPLSPEERSSVIRALKLSPRALAQALRPIELITNHRLDENQGFQGNAMIDQTDKNIFFQHLSPALVADCTSQEMAAYYSGWRGVWEVEHGQNVIIKSGKGIDAKLEWRSRHTARPSNVQGGFLHLLIPDDGPEPWEEVARKQAESEQEVA